MGSQSEPIRKKLVAAAGLVRDSGWLLHNAANQGDVNRPLVTH
jgi:hypothetical protein